MVDAVCGFAGRWLLRRSRFMCLLQITLAVVFSGWAHVLHAVFKPWGRDSLTYKVQHLSLFTTTFVFIMGLLFKVKGVNTDAASFKALSAIMLLLCLSFGIVWLVAMTIGVRATLARKRLAKQARRFTSRPGLPPGYRAGKASGAAPPSNVWVSGEVASQQSANVGQSSFGGRRKGDGKDAAPALVSPSSRYVVGS